MGFRDFLENLFIPKDRRSYIGGIACSDLLTQLWCMNYAQHIVAERYGSLLSKCDFRTYVKDKEVKGDNWWKFNVEPNPNQTSSEFLKQLAFRLIHDLEALIIKTDNGNFYVASSFTKGDRQLAETWFTDVVVDVYEDGTVKQYNLDGVFKGDNAMFIRYKNSNANNLMNEMNALYTNLIENVKLSGSNKIKYTLEIDTTAANGIGVDYDKEIARILNEDFQKLASDNNVILPLMKGFKLEPLNQANYNSQNATVAAINVNSMFEDILVNVGQIYNVPKSFMMGTYEDGEMDDFLTFGLDPFVQIIQEAINRKYYGKKQYLAGTYVMIDTKKIKHFDILTVSNAINKLISSGVYTINELRTLLDEKPIDPEIGDKHWITRNYAVVGDYIAEQTNFTGNDPKTQAAREQESEEDEE